MDYLTEYQNWLKFTLTLKIKYMSHEEMVWQIIIRYVIPKYLGVTWVDFDEISE